MFLGRSLHPSSKEANGTKASRLLHLKYFLGTGLQVEGEFRGGDLPGVEFGVRTSGCYYRALND